MHTMDLVGMGVVRGCLLGLDLCGLDEMRWSLESTLESAYLGERDLEELRNCKIFDSFK